VAKRVDTEGWEFAAHTPGLDLLAGQNLDWREAGVCNQTDPDVFFPDTGVPAEPAKAICHRCPSKYPCLRFALDEQIMYGVWGGTSPRERRRMLRRPPGPVGRPVATPEPAPQLSPAEVRRFHLRLVWRDEAWRWGGQINADGHPVHIYYRNGRRRRAHVDQLLDLYPPPPPAGAAA
jgi:Transcription factor WhiB